MPLLAELRHNGATDYAIFPLPFLDHSRTRIISFATQSATGFSDNQIVALERASKLLSPYAERYVLRRIAIDLLNTYVGRRSGERVFSGAIRRGVVEHIQAAILVTDIRGFTRFSDSQPIDLVLEKLNSFFEEMVSAVEDHGGEVLKFMGDSLLAIFPAQQHSLSIPCSAALAAARDGWVRLHKSNTTQQGKSLSLAACTALHAGEIAYGNIGGRLRLDFTAIGPVINHTSRLLELAKSIDVAIVASAAFEHECGVSLPSLGLHHLRDVDEQQPIFTVSIPE